MRPGRPRRGIFGIRRPGGEERDEEREKKRRREKEKKREKKKRTFSRRQTNWYLRLLSKAKLGECSGRGGRLWGQEKKRKRAR